VKSPERSELQSPGGEEDDEKQKAREDAIAALEGKKRRPSKPQRPLDDEVRFDILRLRSAACVGRREEDEETSCTAQHLLSHRDTVANIHLTELTIANDFACFAQVYDLKIQLHHESHAPTTHPLLYATDAATLLHKVRPGHQRCLMEVWPSLGIQRQVRYFEQVSDVVNTWDVGTTSHLRLDKKVWGESVTRLEDFPKAEPTIDETMFYYYVTADKKWGKRSVSIGSNQLRILKRDRPYDKDYLQTINLDNFDVYAFTDTFAPTKQLKCPTKFCFALKSQHKQSLFSKNSVFVHYFATDDKSVFARWYAIVRDFKARLLAEKKAIAHWIVAPQDESVQTPGQELLNPFADAASPTSPPRGRHPLKPLISPEELAAPPIPLADMARSKSLHRGKSTKHSKKDRSPSVPVIPTGLPPGEVFSPGGLLGSDYEEKRKLALMAFKEERSKDGVHRSKTTAMRKPPLHQPMVPPTDRPRTSDSYDPEAHAAPQRRGTVRRPSTAGSREAINYGTLLNFSADEISTPLPHHHRRRANTALDHEGGLISLVAGAPDVPPIPSSAVASSITRRPTTGGKKKPLVYSSDDEYSPFTGTGLLAMNFHSAGTTATGHGIKTQRDAVAKNGEINPFMDVGPKSIFAPGSLLERRERETGPTRPIIDRDPHSSDEDEFK